MTGVQTEVRLSRTYHNLVAWQKSKSVAKVVYQKTEFFPRAERFGLTSQVRRAAVSIASNIAEGQGRLTRGEFRPFPGQARGSLFELETQLDIAHDLGYLLEQEYRLLESQSFQVLGLLNRLIESLSQCRSTPKTLKPSPLPF